MSQIKCPTCGAATSDTHDSCEYCGVDLSAASNLNPDQHTKAFAKYIEQTVTRARAGAENPESFDVLNRKVDVTATAIKSFPAPTKPDSLAAFFVYCHGNVTAEGDKVEIEAWRSKAKGAYEGLRLLSLSNPPLASFLEDFRSSYSADASRAIEAAAKVEGKKNSVFKMIAMVVVGLVNIMLFVGIFSLIRSCNH
jgi:hypothetical protein